jgi:hypothetical protein
MNPPISAEQQVSAAAASSRQHGLMGLSDKRARSTDPATSHEAAAMAISFISRHQSLVLQALADMGQAGAEQIGEQIGMPAYAVRKRTSELERLGLIADTGITRKTSSGRSERVWGVC